MASTTVSLPLPSSRRGLRWRPDKVLRVLMQDRTLGYLLLPPAILVIVGLVAYCQRHRDDLPGEDGRRPGRFIGLDNYRELFSSEQFARTVFNTFAYTAVGVGLKFLLGLSMALVLNQERFCNNLFRSFLLVPGPFRRSCRPQLALDLRRRQRADQQRPGASGADRGDHLLAVQPAPGHALGDRGGGLAGHAVLHHELPGRPAGPQGALRSGGDRRGVVIQQFKHITLPWLKPIFITAVMLSAILTSCHPVRPDPDERRACRPHHDLLSPVLSPGAPGGAQRLGMGAAVC